MKLSQLVYLCVKNAIYYDDPSFTYENFIMGKYIDDPDYATNVHNVYAPLNEAISRLNDLDRIPYAMAELNSDNSVFSTSEISDMKEIIAVGATYKDEIRPLQFVYMYGQNRIKVFSDIYKGEQIWVEYKRKIPQFMEAPGWIVNNETDNDQVVFFQYNVDYTVTPNTVTKVCDVDLQEEYGIKHYDYIIEYVKGYLLEPIDAVLANMHLNRAEQYFAATTPEQSAFAQRVVERVHEIL